MAKKIIQVLSYKITDEFLEDNNSNVLLKLYLILLYSNEQPTEA